MGGAMTIVGDASQQTDPTAWFAGWSPTLHSLRQVYAKRRSLRSSYRCLPAVMTYAQAVIDGSDAPVCDDIRLVRHADEAAQLAAVSALPDHVAVVCASAAHASQWRKTLRGRTVTHVAAVKGLEFDAVALVDVDPAHYADGPRTRRELYVALTRGRGQVTLSTTGAWAPVLPTAQNRPTGQSPASHS